MPEKPDYGDILRRLMFCLSLGDHMGDVYTDLDRAIKSMGIEITWMSPQERTEAFEKMGWRGLYDPKPIKLKEAT